MISKVLYLKGDSITTGYYSGNPTKTVDFLLSYDSILLMEPGELADYAQGLKLLQDSSATIHILEPGKTLILPLDRICYIFAEEPNHYSIGIVEQKGKWTNKRERYISNKN